MRLFISIFTVLLLSFTQAQTEGNPQQDIISVETIVNSLFTTTDNKDWQTLRNLFTDNIDVDFSSLGAEPGRIPADNLVSGWEQGLHAQKESHHMTSNHQIVIQGDSAEVTAQGYAYNRLLEPAGDGFWEVWGVYKLVLVRTNADWKIASITFEAKHSRGDASVPAHVLE